MPPILSGYAKQQRLRQIQPLLRGRILDLGCGFTVLPEILAVGQSYTGLDSWERALVYARRRYVQHTFHQRDLDHEPLNLGDEQFDTIVMMAVIEHLHRPEQLLLQVRSLLAPGGHLLLTTPSPFGDFLHRIGSRIGLFYSEDQVAHVKIFGKGDLFQLVGLTGYAVLAYKRFQFQSNQMLVCQVAKTPGNN